uniref:Uncharacterized protein n=1 Tax=Chromera velia CCMP2878 TaxID=1169474 RepID=A0A0G4HSG8_9ALVE|eukprot:Cvel_31001.t1-p1 / transcript=Cvel_31001.t1 / gene=Cvel_31001 / organism=Chromera_velia_CCMP2878 / gene_product=hypothetical protein / transcript_product=hypothetical protein / location=Cvel_scaffold4533:4064-4973(+) / protein_length=138 / sequence_SO=supercontig / SO=protein_coding / is_pseudo=false
MVFSLACCMQGFGLQPACFAVLELLLDLFSEFGASTWMCSGTEAESVAFLRRGLHGGPLGCGQDCRRGRAGAKRCREGLDLRKARERESHMKFLVRERWIGRGPRNGPGAEGRGDSAGRPPAGGGAGPGPSQGGPWRS